MFCSEVKVPEKRRRRERGPTTIHQQLTRMRGPSDALTNNNKPNIKKDRLNLGSSYPGAMIAES
jgi:hypothetical protein